MNDLEKYAGRRIEIEHEGRRFKGQVIRGPGRKPLLLEERGQVGEKSGAHNRLAMLRTWTASQLAGAKVVQILPPQEPPKKRSRRKSPKWADTVVMAEADPASPPSDWEGGLLSWAEKVHAARRKVDRGRKAMLQALKKAAG